MRSAARATLAVLLASSPSWAAISGRVLDRDGRPIAGATVSAYARETPEQRARRLVAGAERVALATARTAPDGAFQVQPAGGAALAVEARAEGYAPVAQAVLGDEPLAIELPAAALRRAVVSAGGRPVAGAHVAWLQGDAEWLATTAADGSYQVPEPRAWASQVFVLHPGFAPDDSAGMGEALPQLERTLEAGWPVEGVVRDERGRPVAGAAVWIGTWTMWPLATTTADGRFRVAHAPARWSSLQARTTAVVGTAERGAARVSVVARPARTLAGRVRDAAGRPLAGALVQASARGSRAAAFTDAAGRYELPGLRPGRYAAAAMRPGYLAASEAAPPEIDLRDAARASRDFVLRAIPIVRGRVEDESHRPVDGALVELGFRATPHLYASHVFAEMDASSTAVRTGADGSFAVPRPQPTQSWEALLKDRPLVVLKPGFAAARVELDDAAAARPVVVTLTRGVALAGRVVTPEGRPLAGVGVTLAEDGTVAGSMLPSWAVIASLKDKPWVVTDGDGRFEARVHPAVHHLAFRAAGWAPRVLRDQDPRRAEPVQVVMEPAAFVRGRVVHADGRGVAGVTVTLTQPAMMEAATATTAEDGRFEIPDLAAGTYDLTARSDDFALDLTRPVEAPAPDLQIVLDPGGTLRGRVTDAVTRQPVKAYELTVHLPDDRGARTVEVDDAQGAFEVDDVRPGEAAVTVMAPGYARKRVEGVVVAVGEPAAIEVALDTEALLRGRITGDGRPVAEAQVNASGGPEGPGAQTTSGDDGEYELHGLPPGPLTLSVTAAGYLPEKRAVDLAQALRVDVALRRGLSLTGSVTSEGAPVPGASVVASAGAANANYAAARTDEQGAFRLEGLAPGRYAVTAQAEGKGRAQAEDVDPETAAPLQLVLPRPRTALLTGRLVGLAPEDGTMAFVTASSEDDGMSSMAMVDRSLAFHMEDAPAGRVTVAAQATSMGGGMARSSRKVELTLAPGSQTETVLEFPSGVVSGIVTRDGGPLAGVTVSFLSSAGSVSARTDARGAYQAVGLDPGRYGVVVSGNGTSFSTEYVATGSGEFDIDVTGSAVRGRVVRADGGQPLRDVQVSLWRLGSGENSPAAADGTNERGEFAVRSLHEGRYRLTTFKAGFGPEVREVALERGGTAEVQIELAPAEGLTLTVVDARDGRPLEATVVVRDLARRIVANRHSDAAEDGTINIPVADGAYLLSTSASGYGTVTLRVTAPARGLRVPLTVGGTLVIESARELRGRVRLIQPDGDEYVQCWCNGIADIRLEGRRTKVEHVTGGAYTMEVLDGEDVVARKAIVVQESQTTTVVID